MDSSASRAERLATAPSTLALAADSSSTPLCFFEASSDFAVSSLARPSAILARPLLSSPWASASFSSTLASTLSFSASILSWSSVTCSFSSSRPVPLTEATPSSRSKAGTTVSSTRRLSALASMPSASTLATITGSISGLIFISIGAPTASSSCALTRSTLPDSSIMAESILVPCSNSRMIMLEFSCETELTWDRPLVVPSTDSSGRVTASSTFSGLAPG